MLPTQPRLTRALIGPPGRILLPLVALAGLIILYSWSTPGRDLVLGFVGGVLAIGTVIVWLPRLAVCLLRSDGRPGLRKHWVRWASAPVMGVAVIGLASFEVPAQARFALSEGSLESFARTVAAQPGTRHADQWVGLYPLTAIERTEGGARFLVEGSGFLAMHGFAWSPEGAPDDEQGSYVHLRGPWYEWWSRW